MDESLPMEYLFEYLRYACIGYIFSSILMLLLSLFLPGLKSMRKSYLTVSNRIGMIVIWSFLLLYLGDFFYNNLIRNNTSDNRLFVRYRIPFLTLLVILKGVPALFFLKKKLRYSIVVTCLVITVFIMSFFTETIYIFIFFSNRDMLSSSWSYYISYSELIGLPVISALLYAAIVLLVVKRKAALQQPSVVE